MPIGEDFSRSAHRGQDRVDVTAQHRRNAAQDRNTVMSSMM
jgi:hypothetical protein